MTMKLKIYKGAEEAAAILARGGFEDEEIAKSVPFAREETRLSLPIADNLTAARWIKTRCS